MPKTQAEYAKDLQALFDYSSPWDKKGQAFVHTESASKDLRKYGSFKYVCEDDLKKRKYILSTVNNDRISIFYTDVWFDPKTMTHYPREENDRVNL